MARFKVTFFCNIEIESQSFPENDDKLLQYLKEHINEAKFEWEQTEEIG